MEIRQENYCDYKAVYKLIKEAFAKVQQSDGNEQELVVALRNSKSFVPQLSLVAVENGMIVGHILFTKVYIGLPLLCCRSILYIRGIGLALIEKGHSIAKKLGYNYPIVLGHSKYYPKAGYLPASVYGIKAPFDVSDENFMAIKLRKEARRLEGVIKYDDAFGIK